MLAIMLMLVGLAVLVGAKDIAGRLLKVLVGVLLLCIAIPCLLQWCGCLLQNAGSSEHGAPANAFLVFLLLAALVGIGAIGWKLRAWRARARELAMRRNGAPRTRALPPAPPPFVGGQS